MERASSLTHTPPPSLPSLCLSSILFGRHGLKASRGDRLEQNRRQDDKLFRQVKTVVDIGGPGITLLVAMCSDTQLAIVLCLLRVAIMPCEHQVVVVEAMRRAVAVSWKNPGAWWQW